MGNRYLIDTHILLWWVFDDPKLDQTSQQIIQNSDNQIFVSSAFANIFCYLYAIVFR